MATLDVLTAEKLIKYLGIRRYSKCSLCQRHNLWEIEGCDKKPNAILCSWCDVEKPLRWQGVKEYTEDF